MRSQAKTKFLSGARSSLLSLARAAAVVLLLAGFLPAGAASAKTFEDVPPPAWAVTYIDTVTTAGIMDGCGGPFFCPYDPVTREDTAVWLERGMRGAGFVPPPVQTSSFADVDASYCLAPWFEQLYADHLTVGCALNPLKFCPYKVLPRSEMAVFLLRAEHGGTYQPPDWCPAGGTGSFQDVPCSHWAADWIDQLYREGITAGCSANPPLFCPDAQVTRAQMATFLVRTFNLQ